MMMNMAASILRAKTSSELNSNGTASSASGALKNDQQNSDVARVEVGVFNCPTCKMTWSLEDVFQLTNCAHRVCRPCARAFLLDWQLLRCPLSPRCTAEMDRKDAMMVMDELEVAFLCYDDGSNSHYSDDVIVNDPLVQNLLMPSTEDLPSPAPPGGLEETLEPIFECDSCSHVLSIEDIFQVGSSCAHRLCRDCAKRHVAASCSDRSPVFRCPVSGCHGDIDPVNVELVLDFSAIQLEDARETFECKICGDLVAIDDVFRPERCQHQICRECARHYLRSLIDDRRELRCPFPDCEAELTLTDVELVIDADEYKKLSQVFFEKAIADCFRCPKPDCGGLAEIVPPRKLFLCPICHHQMCVDCRTDWHATVTCAEHQQWLEDNGKADERFDDYVKTQKLQPCPQCRQAVEKTEGCNHMTCHCGAHFCYLCGKRFTVANWQEHSGCELFRYNFVE